MNEPSSEQLKLPPSSGRKFRSHVEHPVSRTMFDFDHRCVLCFGQLGQLGEPSRVCHERILQAC